MVYRTLNLVFLPNIINTVGKRYLAVFLPLLLELLRSICDKTHEADSDGRIMHTCDVKLVPSRLTRVGSSSLGGSCQPPHEGFSPQRHYQPAASYLINRIVKVSDLAYRGCVLPEIRGAPAIVCADRMFRR